MLGEEQDKKTHPPPPLPLPLPPPPAVGGVVGGGDHRKIYSRSVSWAGGRSPITNSNPPNPKSLWNTKARGGCLPPLQPLSVSRPKAHEWPRAGSDDLGVWPTVAATTPGVRPRPPALPLNLDKSLGKPPREFEFKKDKLAFFDKECSRIIDHVFLGSDCVAKNRDVLRQNGITHVLNCVGFVCPEYFKNDLVYKTLWLQDSPSEDITSILYDVFDYFEDVKEQKGRVFVHCCQGVSRSTSLVIAYLMWREGHSFEDAFQQVKAARGVTNPNMGFASQLLQCQKRVHAVPVSPSSVLRMYRMAPHSSYAPLHLVPKLLARPNAEALDSRGAFIVNVPSAIYVWIGKDCDLLMYESARLAASQVIRYEKANGPALTIREGKEPIEFWDVLGNDQEQFTGDKSIIPGERKIANYDIDFGVFNKAANSGVVPPLSISGHNDSEMCLPARRSGWERLRKKFATGVMKELIISSKEVEFFESPCESPDSCSYSDISESRDWVKAIDSKGKEDDNSECLSPYSFSSFLVKDSRKFDNSTSPSLSPSTSDYSNSFSFSPTSSNWSDLSISAQPSPSGLEASDPSPNPNPKVREISPSTTGEIPRTLVRTWSFSMEDEAMEDAEDESLIDEEEESMFDAENHPSEESKRVDLVLYQWPAMEEVEMSRPGIPDSRAVYITCVTDPSLGTKSPDVLYIWVGRDASDISGHDDSCNDSYIQWQAVGRDFLIRKGLGTSAVVEIVREGEEPEQLWKHLHCFSFQNTAEKGDK